MTDDERRANEKLMVWREEVANDHTYNATIHNFFQNKAMLEASKLYRALNVMPKGGLHHIHTSAANPVNAYIQLTYDDKVYWSQHERLFKVYPKHEGVAEGYIQCTKLREFSKDKKEFDSKLRDQILLTAE